MGSARKSMNLSYDNKALLPDNFPPLRAPRFIKALHLQFLISDY
jgi:hypothetical protein